MKLRLTQSGFEKYTGQMGVVMFKDGLSETEVLPIDGIRIAAAIGATWEDGSAANVGQMYLNNMDAPAFVGTGGEGINAMSMPIEGAEQQGGDKPSAGNTRYTRKQLEAVADKSGTVGLREIAETLKVKGTSIVGLIETILKAQDNQKAE